MIQAALERLTLTSALTYGLAGALILGTFALRPEPKTTAQTSLERQLQMDVPTLPQVATEDAVERLRRAGFFLSEQEAQTVAGAVESVDLSVLPRFAGVIREPETGIYALVKDGSDLRRMNVGDRFGSYTLEDLNTVSARFSNEDGEIFEVKLYDLS